MFALRQTEITQDLLLDEILFEDAAALLDILANHAGVKRSNPNRSKGGTVGQYPFPGPNPVSIDRSDFPKFSAQPYLVTEKTDGVRALMLLCDYRGVHLQVLFPRNLRPYLFAMQNVPRALYGGTVFDGELVWDRVDERFVYLMYDAIDVSGVPVFHLPFTKRLDAIRMGLSHYTPHDKDPGLLRVKTFIPFTADPAPLDAHIKKVNARYATDGIIFMPEFDRVLYGRHDTLFKLKQHHTLDFLCKNGKLHIYDETTKRNRVVGVATGPNAHLATQNAIVECEWDAVSSGPGKYDAWRVLMKRTDKTTSNNKYTYDKTLLNIRENLTYSDILKSVFSSHGNPRWE